ncbi:MAG: hypothetical protein ACFFCH_09330 [Promethearchaeota archaeon]
MDKIKAALLEYESEINRINDEYCKATEKLDIYNEEERNQYLGIIEKAGFQVQQAEYTLLRVLQENKHISESYSTEDLEIELGILRSPRDAWEGIIDPKVISEIANELLLKEESHEIYIPIGIGSTRMLSEFPDGYFFGNSQIIERESLPKAMKKEVEKSKLLQAHPRWVKLQVDIPGPEQAMIIGETRIAQDLDIHRFQARYPWEKVLGREFQIVFCYSPIMKIVRRSRIQQLYGSDYHRLKKLMRLPLFEKLSILRRNASSNEMVNRLQMALSFIGLAQSANDDALMFALLVTALEALVLPKETKTQLSRTFSQYCAVLSSDESESRIKNSGYFKTAYGKRSAVFHGQRPKVNTQECTRLLAFCRSIFLKVLDLFDSQVIQTHKEFQSKLEVSLYSGQPLAS